MKFIDLFAGIGGFRLGMEMAGHKPVGWCEIDKFAQRSYRAMYNTEGEWFADDIQTVEPRDIPDFDCITGGFPCQAFSVAGKRGGFEDTRGTLFFEIARIIRERKPQLVFLENVRGLLNHDGGKTFGTILNTFWELGYDVEWQLLNSKDFGVPQNRERVFIIGYPRGTSRRKIFPIRENNRSINELQGQYTNTLTARYEAAQATGSYIIESKQYEEKRVPMILDDTRSEKFEGVLEGTQIRRLTPRECFRLQGFPDELFEKAREVNSDSQLYKQAGNAVTVNVIYEIAKRF